MSIITWTKEQFGTSVSKHDEEHQTLFGKLNDLHKTVSGGDRKVIGDHLDGLIAYVAKHFASEEENMKTHGYTAYVGHKAMHDDLVAKCVDLQKKFHAGQADVTADTTAFVKDWLTNHIPNIDRQYGPYLNSKGVA